MSLLDLYSADCVLITRKTEKDPVGGYKHSWVEGASFSAAFEYDSAPEVLVAEKQGVTRTYWIYTDKTLDLQHHDVFRRKDTGQIYRVTNPGTDRMTPVTSRLNRRLYGVEEWELPHDDEEEQENVQGS